MFLFNKAIFYLFQNHGNKKKKTKTDFYNIGNNNILWNIEKFFDIIFVDIYGIIKISKYLMKRLFELFFNLFNFIFYL